MTVGRGLARILSSPVRSQLQCLLQVQLFSARCSAFAFNFSEKRCTFNGLQCNGQRRERGEGTVLGTRSLLLFKVSLSLSLSFELGLLSWPWLSNPANECGFFLIPPSLDSRCLANLKNEKCIFQIEFSTIFQQFNLS